MSAPTLYFLRCDFNHRANGYEVWEHHCGQDIGCISTGEEFVDVVPKGQLDDFINKFADKCAMFGDKLEKVEVKP